MSSTGPVICEGWVLKKRRKKMQGFARRYFTLYQSGLLEYSFEPGKPARDQLYLPSAAISTTPGQKDVHLDSNTATFHIKCLSTTDFERWMAGFRRFIASEDRAMPRRSSTARTMPRLYGQVNKALQEMGTTLSDLEDALQSLSSDDPKKKHVWKEKSREHIKESGPKFNLFKKGHSNHDTPSESYSASSLQRLQAVIDALKSQHTILVNSLTNIPLVDQPGSQGRTLPSTQEEDFTSSPRDSRRTSTASGGSLWFDAPEPDGALEFVLETTAPQAALSEFTTSGMNVQEPEEMEESGEDTDEEEGEVMSRKSSKGTGSHKNGKHSQGKSKPHGAIVRRTQLPSGPVGDEGSLFAVLRKNVGKDLSQVAMPVSFNEPLTMLQRAAEELEYFDLLRQASATDDPVERLCLVAAFAVSGYACTKNRSGRKSFNPMLGETFEDPRMNYVAEKVSHQPLIIAYHASGDGWELTATSSGKTKFWGKSLEIIPIGVTHVKIGADDFEWRKPSSFMRNLMMGTKYLEHCGQLTVENKTSKARCVLDFQETGYWSPPNVVAGTVFSTSGDAETSLEGKWDEQLAQKLDSDHLRVLWRINPFPKNSRELYGFTSFAITLNEITSDLEGQLPPTDSRLRPDVRALEEGDLDRAEDEKKRVEDAQRERRKRGQNVEPRWFKEVGQDDWEYVGGYWETREKGWAGAEPLW